MFFMILIAESQAEIASSARLLSPVKLKESMTKTFPFANLRRYSGVIQGRPGRGFLEAPII